MSYLEKLKSLCDEATPGEWEYDSNGDYIWRIKRHGENGGYTRVSMVAEVRGVGEGLPIEPNGRFIAEARVALPRLVEAVEELMEVAKGAECLCGAAVNERLEVVPTTCDRCDALAKAERILEGSAT